jgi:hypothetical protein
MDISLRTMEYGYIGPMAGAASAPEFES